MSMSVHSNGVVLVMETEETGVREGGRRDGGGYMREEEEGFVPMDPWLRLLLPADPDGLRRSRCVVVEEDGAVDLGSSRGHGEVSHGGGVASEP